MKKILLASLALIFLQLGCSSPQVKTERSFDDAFGGDTASDTPDLYSEKPAPTPSKPVSRDLKSEFTRAIESKNPSVIKRAALNVLESDPNHLQAQNALALVHLQDGQIGLAKMIIQRALNTHKKSGLYNNLGVIYLKEGKEKEAIEAFRKAIKIDTRNDEAAANMGALYVKNQDYSKAVTVLKMAYDAGNRELSTLHNYAVALTATGKASQAEKHYESVLEKQPNSTEVLTNYTIYLIDHKKDYSKGLEYLNKLRFIGVPSQVRDKINELEKKARDQQAKG